MGASGRLSVNCFLLAITWGTIDNFYFDSADSTPVTTALTTNRATTGTLGTLQIVTTGIAMTTQGFTTQVLTSGVSTST